MRINLFSLANLNIRANPAPSFSTGSVRFAYDDNSNFQTEGSAPYAMAGDSNGVYSNWTPTLGIHTVTATPYSGTDAGGIAGDPVTVTFTVIDQASAPGPLISWLFQLLGIWSP